MWLLLGARPFPEKGEVGRRILKEKEGKGVRVKRKRYKVTKGEWYKNSGGNKEGEVDGDK